MEAKYKVTFEAWDEIELLDGWYQTYAEALENACEFLCDCAMRYSYEGYIILRIYKDGECIWSNAVGIDR